MPDGDIQNGSTKLADVSFDGDSTAAVLDLLDALDDPVDVDSSSSFIEKLNPLLPSEDEDAPSLTLSINNVVVMSSMQCHLRLKEIARSSVDVEHKALQNHVIMRLRSPYTVATIWSSGKVWCTGANSLAKAKIGARRVARRIEKCGFRCKFGKFRVVNIMATCRLPFRVRLEELVKERPLLMSYEPELSPGLTFKLDRNSSCSLKVFATGRAVIMGPSMEMIGNLVEELVPLAALHQTGEPVSDSDDETTSTVGDRKVGRSKSAALDARQMALTPPGGLSADVFARLVSGGYDDEDDEGDYSESDDDGKIERPHHDPASDVDSSDSEASTNTVGSRAKHRSTTSIPVKDTHSKLASQFSGSSLRVVSMTPRGVRNIVAAAGDARQQQPASTSILRVQPSVGTVSSTNTATVPWSRKSVASGATKRACVVTYSGKEDSGAPTDANNQSSRIVHPTVRIVQPSIPTNHPTILQPSPQYLVVSSPQAILQPTQMQTAQVQCTSMTATHSLPNHLQMTSVIPNSSLSSTVPTQLIQLNQASPSTVLTSKNGFSPMTPSTAIYSVRLPTGSVQPTVPAGTKLVTMNSVQPPGQFITVNTAAIQPSSVTTNYHQFYPNPVAQQPVLLGSTMYHAPINYSTARLPISNHVQQSAAFVPGSLGGGNNLMIGTFPVVNNQLDGTVGPVLQTMAPGGVPSSLFLLNQSGTATGLP